jgi:RNA polymerase sigma-70 factor (ECF subfamily)
MSTHTHPPSPHDFRAFYDHYFPSVWRFLEKLRVRAADKPDLAQRVFSLAFEKRGEIPRDRARAWLLTTCRNFTRNDRRCSRNTLEVLDPRAVASTPDPRDVERFRIDLDLASYILEKMKPLLADVFIRHEIEHEPLHAIAAALGMCRATAWHRVQVAKSEFRRIEYDEMRGRRRPRRALFILPFGLERLSSPIARAHCILRRALSIAAPMLTVALFAAIVMHHGVPTASASHSTPPARASAAATDIEAPPTGGQTADATPLGTTAHPAVPRPSPSRPRPSLATRKTVRHEKPTREDPDADRLGFERARRTFALGQYGAALAQIADVMRDHPDSQYVRALRALRAEAMERLGRLHKTTHPRATVDPGP